MLLIISLGAFASALSVSSNMTLDQQNPAVTSGV